MNKILAAAVLLAAASTGAAFAQNGTSMLGIAAEREAMELGVKGVDADTLSLTQLSLINAITASSSYSTNEKAKQVRAIVGY